METSFTASSSIVGKLLEEILGKKPRTIEPAARGAKMS
jgi:hypothetical protein